MFKKNFKGFTLIELLVAITIISIIAAVGFTSYNAAQVRGRDAKRKQDLRAIAVALEIYRQKNGRYPCDSTAATHQTSYGKNPGDFWIVDRGSACDSTLPAVPFDQNFISSMPLDPLNTGDVLTAGNYSYSYNNGGNGGFGGTCGWGQGFILRARLENINDKDSCKAQQYKRCDGAALCSDTSTSKDNEFFIVAQ